ncbi:MAG TPA: L,D-transpeptidase family protein [Burkholderiales bacterium]|nr:L,D-transpeptidase family protein [Burkholderiales bacterium]
MHSRRKQAGYRQPLLQALAVIVLAAASYAWAITFLPTREQIERQLALPEAMLVQALVKIGENRIGAALEEIDNILAVNPNFRLAQLIRGDLLLARARPIQTVGAAPGASLDHMADFRDEALARLARYSFQPPTDLAPGYVLQPPQDSRYALLIDTSKSTLFVLENRQGTLRYVADYYVSIGRNGIAKQREGDRKTPVGVYHVTSRMPQERLTDFYGSGAFPINYPNEWDRVQRRDGYGIWLHGTPRDTYSRPPRASDGCVVLANEDLNDLAKYLDLGRTPVVISESVSWVKPREVAAQRDDLLSHIERWRTDWESLNTDNYLKHYSGDFSARGTDIARWSAHKRQVNAAKTWIKVGVADLSMMLYPGEKNLAVITFSQDYASNNLTNSMKKRQYWLRESDNRWRIVYEGAA